jgi:hypothetical protein
MLRTSLCTLMALALSASILAAADPKGGNGDKPFTATIVKVDAAKHLLVFKSKTAAGKDVEQSLPIKAGVQLPNVAPGSTFTIVEQSGQVIALKAIPQAPAVVKTPKPDVKATARAPAAKGSAKAPVAKEVATRGANARMIRGQAWLTKANKEKAMAVKVDQGCTVALKEAQARLALAKAAEAKAIQERDAALQLAKAKVAAARQAHAQLMQAQAATANAYKTKVAADQLVNATVTDVAAATRHLDHVKAAFAKAVKDKVAKDKAAKDKAAADKKPKAVNH